MKNDGLLSLEYKIANLLRWGVLLAGGFLFVGWMSFLDFSQNRLASLHEYTDVSLSESLQTALQHSQWGLLMAYMGLALLVSLPLLRVLMTAFLFIQQKEKLLATVAFFVFAILLLSFSLGIEL